MKGDEEDSAGSSDTVKMEGGAGWSAEIPYMVWKHNTTRPSSKRTYVYVRFEYQCPGFWSVKHKGFSTLAHDQHAAGTCIKMGGHLTTWSSP